MEKLHPDQQELLEEIGRVVFDATADGRSAAVIESFGFLHEPTSEPVLNAPHLVLDLREVFRDPHIDPSLREATGRDDAVRDNVLRQPGALSFVLAQASAIEAMAAGSGRPVRVRVGCAGGRHRSVVIGEALARTLADLGIETVTHHRDVTKPVVHRPPQAEEV